MGFVFGIPAELEGIEQLKFLYSCSPKI